MNTASFTAGLQYVSQSGTGNTAQLTSNIASAFTGVLAAGNNIGLQANLRHRLRRHFLRRVYADAFRRRQHHRPHQPKRNAQSRRPSAQQRHDLLDRRRRFRLGFEPHQNQLDRSVVERRVSARRHGRFQRRAEPIRQPLGDVEYLRHAGFGHRDHSTGSDYTISGSGAIGGSGGLTKTGSGKFTLSTNNTYSGGTTVNAGTLVVGHVNALGSGGLTINSTATTQLQAGLSGPVQLPSLVDRRRRHSPTATLDITDNNMIVHNGDLATLTAQAKAAAQRQWLDWTGTGITSSTARDDANFATAVGVIQNDDGGRRRRFTAPGPPGPIPAAP